MRIYIWLLLLLWLGCMPALQAQQLVNLDLDQAIELAKKQSPDALLATNKFRSSYWRYRYYRADYLPALTAQTTLPDLNRSITRITLPDGTDSFVNRQVANSTIGLSLNQQIGPTGASVFLNTGLSRIDIFNENRVTSYLSTPVSIGISQPLLTYNRLKWQKRIEPLFFQEARRQYSQDMEDLALKTINLYFDVLKTRQSVNMARLDKANSDTLYKLAVERYKMGRIAENELLQHELNLLNADLAGKQAAITSGAAAAKLRSFLGLSAADSLVLEIPGPPDTMQVDAQQAWLKAQEYSTMALNFDRREIEAERDVAKAKGDNGIQGSLRGEFGLNKKAATLSEAYVQPQDQERLLISLQMPILDWGKTKGAIELAKAQQQLVQTNIRQEVTDFEQLVTLQALQYNLQSGQLKSARKADEVAQRRFFIAKQRFLLGKIGVTDLNIAQADRDAAQRGYIDFLRSAWVSYYQLRKITLYDFKNNVPLSDVHIPEL